MIHTRLGNTSMLRGSWICQKVTFNSRIYQAYGSFRSTLHPPIWSSSSPLIRHYQHLTPKSTDQDPRGASKRPSGTSISTNNASEIVGKQPEREISNKEQRRRDWVIIKRLLVHIWPPNDWSVRGRVILGVGLLVTGKVCFVLLKVYLLS